jgi:heptaprenyl diphosphate synthase
MQLERRTTESMQSRSKTEKSRKKTKNRTYEIALGGILTVLALMFSYIESFLPASPGLPGVKLGLANLVILVLLYRTNWKMALSVNIMRILMSGLLFSGLFGAVYSLCGGLLSFFIMLICMKTNLFSVIGVSMAGGVFHNIGQLLIAAAITETVNIFYYLPILILSGTASGILIGIAAYILIRAMPAGVFRENGI